jgi:serine/threonine protein kinase/tetratricopeptide (TPR) repeat protein
MNIQPGTNLASYRIVEKLGEGGMGVVWRAEDSTLGRPVAIKVLSADTAADPDRLLRFEREARAVAGLNHPNIVTLYSVEEDQGVRFITMELVEGKTLSEMIRGGGLTLEKFFDIAVPLADALSEAHRRGIVHRDLKPTNVMVDREGRPKVLDFGLAKLQHRTDAGEASDLATLTVTDTGHVVGTVPYMSPEQLQGHALDPRTDLFSIGVILYEMATGRRPFNGSSAAVVISSILRDSPEPVSEVKLGLPNQLGRIVRHCLEKDPERRYQTAKDLRNELADLRAEVESGALPRRPRIESTRRSSPALLLGGGLLVLLVIAVGLGWLLRGQSQPDRGPSAIAVLPFVNLTGDPAKDYLSEGVSAGLMTQLGEVSGLRVVGRSTAWGEWGQEGKLEDLVERLGVGLLFEGELQRGTEGLRVDVKLSDAESGLLLWAEGFDRSEEDLPTLQQEIARKLTTVLSVPLSRKELRRLARDPTGSFQAYDYLLRGYQQIAGDGPRSIDTATEMFRQAIRLDDRFALAHAGLSEALWTSYWTENDGSRLAEAQREAERALEIDPDLPAAQVALARVHRSTGRYSDSIEELQKALARHPKPDEAYNELAESYQRIGNMEEAERCLRAATALGEDYWFNWNSLGAFLFRLGRYDEAREAFERASELSPPQFGVPRQNLAALTIQEGRFKAAIEIYEQLPRPIRSAAVASNIGTAYYFSDRDDKWDKSEEYYQLAARLDPADAAVRRNLADLYAVRGRVEDALVQYRQALLLVESRLEVEPHNLDLRLQQAVYAAKSQECAKAVRLAVNLGAELPETASDMHKLAHVYAICEEHDAALEAVRSAIELGFPREFIRNEDEFGALRSNPEFVELTETAP